MSLLASCASCSGFLPPTAARCPHCDAGGAGRVLRVGRALFNAAAGGAVAATLMACYGGAPPPETPPTERCIEGSVDEDHDMSCTPQDCNDRDKSVNPFAADIEGDGVDQNCDGVDGVAGAAPGP